MNKKTILIVLCSILSAMSPVKAATTDEASDMADEVLKIRQMPHTELLLKSYLSAVKTSQDTLYALIYIPTYCKRCEVTIPTFYKQIKQIDPQKEVLLITAYKDSTAAAQYNRRCGYEADHYLYDTDNTYEKIFDFNTNGLYGLFVLKICKSAGNLIIGTSMESMGEEDMKSLIAFDKPIEKQTFSTKAELQSSYPSPAEQLIDTLRQKDYPLTTSRETPISFAGPALQGRDNYLLFKDDLAEGTLMFKKHKETYAFETLLQANAQEKKRYIRIPDKLFKEMENNKQVFYIPVFSRFSTNGKHIEMSYSLPDLSLESRDSDNVYIAYYNSPAILSRDLASWQPDSIFSFDGDIAHEDYMTQHFQFSATGDLLFFGCKKKTFPIEVPTELYKGKSDMDPFRDEFYDAPTPFIEVCEKQTHKTRCRLGHLSDAARKSRTGYAFVDVETETDGNDLVYTDGYSGYIYVSSLKAPGKQTEQYQIFHVDTDHFPPTDTTMFYQEEYIKPYNRYFYRQIERLAITRCHIHAFVRYGRPMDPDDTTGYVYVDIDRKKGTIRQWRMPHFTEDELRGHGFIQQSGKIWPAVALKTGGKSILRIYRP